MNQKAQGNFLFWQRWLFYSSLLIAAGGLTIAIPVDPNPLREAYKSIIEKDLLNARQLGFDGDRIIEFICGPLGGTICCAYLLLAYISAYPFRRKERWAQRAVILAFGMWFIIDTAFCLSHHMYFQAFVLNGTSFLQKALPLIFTWKHFGEST